MKMKYIILIIIMLLAIIQVRVEKLTIVSDLVTYVEAIETQTYKLEFRWR